MAQNDAKRPATPAPRIRWDDELFPEDPAELRVLGDIEAEGQSGDGAKDGDVEEVVEELSLDPPLPVSLVIAPQDDELVCAAPEPTTWTQIDGVDCAVLSAFSGTRTIPLADLRLDPLLEKLARLHGLFPPPGSLEAEQTPGPETASGRGVPDGAAAAGAAIAQSEGDGAPVPAVMPPMGVMSSEPGAVVGSGCAPQANSLLRPRPPTGERMRVGGVLWPPGPLGVSAERVAHIVRMAKDAPELRHPHDMGLSRSRLQRLLAGVPNNRMLSGALMVWFHEAGILLPPQKAAQPFRSSRPIRDDIDMAEVAERLDRTALPTVEAVEAAFRE